MKTSKWKIVPICLFMVWTMACQEKANEDKGAQYDNDVSLTREALNEIASILAADPSWITQETITKLSKSSIRLNELPSSSVLSKTSHYNFPVEIELYSKSQANVMAKGATSTTYYVGLDPDVYHFPEDVQEEETGLPVIEEPAFYYDGNSITETTITIDPKNPTNETIFFIKESNDDQINLAKSASTPIAGTYMAFKKIDLKNKEDASEEEFEVYFSYNDPNSTTIASTTTHIFDGGNHLDAAGVYRYYLDINDKEAYEVDPNEEIALVRVDNLSTSLRMVAIEADQSNHTYVQGKYNRTEGANAVVYTQTDFYDMADPTSMVTQNQGYKVDVYNSVNDDRYQHGGIRNISEANLAQRTNDGESSFNTVGVGLTDMDWWMIQLVY
ncbi:hypothetical protein L6Q79_01255 [bacterium]|nr:hypothetical protein [bacterium]NUN45536.1 hypothetical protein [bacterium]